MSAPEEEAFPSGQMARQQHERQRNDGLRILSAHTPGPWRFDGGGVICEGDSGRGIARIITGREDDEYNANARLIAAAPELLEACKAWMVSPMSVEGRVAAISKTDRAIAKAEGKS